MLGGFLDIACSLVAQPDWCKGGKRSRTEPLHTSRYGVPHLQPCEVPACQHLQQGGWLAPVAWVPLLHQLQQSQYQSTCQYTQHHCAHMQCPMGYSLSPTGCSMKRLHKYGVLNSTS